MSKFLNFSYSAIQGSYWMYYGVIISFSSVFLLAKDYSNSEIGIILAVSNILAVILQPVLADIIDRSERISLIGITGGIGIGLLLATGTLYIFSERSLALSILFILLSAWLTALQPLINSMAFYLSRPGHRINFGIARSGGSVAYALLTSILGTLVVAYGIQTIPMTGIVVLILLLISLWATRNVHKRLRLDKGFDTIIENTKKEEEEAINLMDFVRRNKMFIVFTFCIVLIFFQNSVFNNYAMQILAAVGGDSKEMGRLLSFMAILELPGLFFFSRLREKFSCQFMLKVASIAFTLKVLLVFMATSVSFIYIAFLFQLISFPIFLSASVHLVDEVMEKGEAVKGQSAITGTMTLSAVFASLVGGAILDISGPSLLLLISTILAVTGTLIVLFTVDRIRPKKHYKTNHK